MSFEKKDGSTHKKKNVRKESKGNPLPPPPPTAGETKEKQKDVEEEILDMGSFAEEELSDVFELSDSQVLLIDESTEEIRPDLTVWSALRESYLEEIKKLKNEDRQRKVRLLYEVGRIEEEVFRDPSGAITNYKKAGKEDNAPPWVLTALRRRYVQANSLKEVINTLENDISSAPDEKARAELYERIGRFYQERLRDNKEALKAFQKSLELDGAFETALWSLSRLYRAMKDPKKRSDSLVSMANATRDPDFKAVLLAEAGFIQLLSLKDSSKAGELFSMALKSNPHHEGARMSLERLFYTEGRWSELADLYVQQGDLASEVELNFANRYLAGVMVWSRLDDTERAISLFEQASALQPDNMLPLWELVELYGDTGQWENLCRTIERILGMTQSVDSPRYVASLHFRLGSILQVRLDRRDEAKERFRKALEVSPADLPARRALASELSREKEWDQLCDLLQIEAEVHEDPRRRAAVVLRQAEITEYEMSNPGGAIELYELAHSLQQNRGPAFRALDRLYTMREEWENLNELYTRELKSCKDKGRNISLQKRRAELLEQRLGRHEEAVEVLEELRKQVDEDREVHLALSRIYERLEMWDKLVTSLKKESDLSQDKDEKCALLCQAASVLEGRLGEDAKALSLYERVLEIDEGHLETLSRLGRLHHRKGRWDKLVEVYRKEVKTSRSASDAADLLFRIGQILETKMADTVGAINSYKEAIEKEKGHVPAQDALSDLLRRSGRWADFLELLDKQAEGGNRTRVALSNLRAGMILEDRLGKVDAAIERVSKALGAEKAASVAHLALERLFAVKKDYKKLSDHLCPHGEGGGWWDPVRVGLRILSVERNHNKDKLKAKKWCEKVISRDPHNTEALANSVELNRTGSSAGELATSIQRIAANLSDPATTVALLKGKESWWGIEESQEGPVPEAFVGGKILVAQPGDSEALETLERVAIEGRNDPALSEILKKMMDQYRHDAEALAVMTVRLGDVMWRLGRIEDAEACYEKAVETNPKDLPSVRSLRVLKQLRGQQEKVAQLLSKESELSKDPEAVTAALMKAGDIWLIEFMDPAKAESAYAKVFEKDPSQEVAFQRLCSLVASRDGYEDLVNLYKKRLATADKPQKIKLLSEMADIYRSNLEDVPHAIGAWEDVIHIDGKNEKALSALSDLYWENQRWRESADCLEKLVKMVSGKDKKLTIQLKHALILKDHLHEDEEALRLCQEILRVHNDNTAALEYSAELELRLGKYEEAAQHLSELADAAQPVDRARYLVKLAKVRERGLNDETKAQEHLIRAAALCLLAPDAIQSLESFFEERKDFEGYENLLSRVLQEAGSDRPGSTALRLSRARNLAHKLLKRDKAEREVQIALEKDPESLVTRLELAALHMMGGRVGLAKAEYNSVVNKDPFDYRGYRGLKEVFLERGEKDRARVASQAVVLFGEANESEKKLAEEGVQVLDQAPVVLGVLNADHIAQFMAPEEEPAAARNLLKTLSPHLHSVFPQDLLSKGVREVQELPSQHPRGELVQRVARRLGIENMRILVDSGVPNRVLMVPGQVPALVLGSVVLKSTHERSFAFEVARNLSLVTTGAVYLKWAEIKELEKLMAGVVCQFDKGFGEHIAPQAELYDLGKSFIKSLPRRERKTLEEPAMMFSRAGTVGMSSWKDAAERTANRVGLCLCGHVEAAVAGLHARKASQEEIASLLIYNVSPRYAEARKICGVTF